MLKIVGLLVIVASTGCFSHARPHYVEAPDQPVGDLHCAQPRLTLLEALHYDPATMAQVQCEPRTEPSGT